MAWSPSSGTRTYTVGDVAIRVRWKTYLPAMAGAGDGAAVVFLPGWSLGAASTSSRRLCQAFADCSGTPACCLDTRAERIWGDSLWQQAEAAGRALGDLGLRRVIVAGHSEGGDKAVDLAVWLEQHGPGAIVDGLILLDPVGLNDQGVGRLMISFVFDALIGTPQSVLCYLAARRGDWRVTYRALRVATDLLAGLVTELATAGSPGCYRRRFLAEVSTLACANRHMAEVRAPVILLQGADDPVSTPGRAGRRVAKSPTVARLFPRSARVCHLVATKLGRHSLPLLRPEATAGATLALLRRACRAIARSPAGAARAADGSRGQPAPQQ